MIPSKQTEKFTSAAEALEKFFSLPSAAIFTNEEEKNAHTSELRKTFDVTASKFCTSWTIKGQKEEDLSHSHKLT